VPDDSPGLTDGFLSGARSVAPWALAGYVRRQAEARGGTDVVLLVQDFDQRVLIPLTDEGLPASVTDAQPINGTVAGRAFSTMYPVEVPDGDGSRLFLPVLDSTERLGVLAVGVGELDDERRSHWREFAAGVGTLLLSKGQHTDVYFRVRRRQHMSLAAEMQWHLLPPLSVEDPRVVIAGLVEPAYNIGGDAFDYAINPDVAHLAVFDAMGHGLDAAVMAGVAVGAYRHGRRMATPVEDLYTMIDAEFAHQFGGEVFATAQMTNLDLTNGSMTVVNAGHPHLLLIRGRHILTSLEGPTTLPVGLGGEAPEVISGRLEPGDRLFLYTDGVVEARRDGDTYGEERLVDDLEHVLGHDLPVPEVLRQLNDRIRDWRGGDPHDDATLVMAEWRGPDPPGF
jgi:sigma-B regulation protein RsbU (phosphoserine phosphatase)